MELYLEVKMDELEREIEKIKNIVAKEIKVKEKFLSCIDKRQYEIALDEARGQANIHTAMNINILQKHLEAKKMIQNGEKVYTLYCRHAGTY